MPSALPEELPNSQGQPEHVPAAVPGGDRAYVQETPIGPVTSNIQSGLESLSQVPAVPVVLPNMLPSSVPSGQQNNQPPIGMPNDASSVEDQDSKDLSESRPKVNYCSHFEQKFFNSYNLV